MAEADEREMTRLIGPYKRIHERLLAEPERYTFRYIVVAALLTRQFRTQLGSPTSRSRNGICFCSLRGGLEW